MRWFALICLFILWIAPAQAAPPPSELCASPRSAADSLFVWQGSDSYDLEAASTCMEVPEGMQRQRVAVQLRQVLDARGIFVPVAQMSADPAYTEDGSAVHVPLPNEFPELVLVRGEDGLWRYSRSTVEAVPRLYRTTFSGLSVWFQNQLPPVFYTRILGVLLWQVLYGALLVGLAFALGHAVRLLLRGQVRRVVRGGLGLEISDTDYGKTNGPIVALVMLGVLSWGLTDLQLGIELSEPLHRLMRAGLWISGLVAISRFVNLGANVARSWAGTTDSKLDDQLIPLLRQSTQLVIFVVGGLYIADALGIDVWKLAAGVGIGGLAFALAAQDTVANVFGSVNIFVDRPFQIGDWVVIGPVEGVVEEVGFRSTRVRTFYNSLVTIPNSQITNTNVDNMGLRPRRRVKLRLGLTYDTPPDKIQAYVEGVRAILAAHPQVERTYEVHLYDLGASAIEILVYYHVKVPGWHEELVTRSQNILEFIRLAHELDLGFAFPSQSLYLESTPDKPLAPHEARTIEELQRIADAFGPGGEKARPEGPGFSKSWSVQARGERQDRGSVSDGAR